VCINRYGHIRSDPYLHILSRTLPATASRVPRIHKWDSERYCGHSYLPAFWKCGTQRAQGETSPPKGSRGLLCASLVVSVGEWHNRIDLVIELVKLVGSLSYQALFVMDRISETTELGANSSGDRDVKRQRQGSISGRLR
jgi:hypothetical protein